MQAERKKSESAKIHSTPVSPTKADVYQWKYVPVSCVWIAAVTAAVTF